MPRRLTRLLATLALLGLALATTRPVAGAPAPAATTGAAARPQAAATAGATRWYFAEGFTATGFDEYLAILNPNPAAAAVRLTYYRDGAAPVVRTLTVARESRATVAVHDEALGVGRNGSRGWEVAAAVEATNGAGIVAERPIYFRYGDGVDGGHNALGAAAPDRAWHFAEGYTGEGFDEYLTILNPNPSPAPVTITYYLADGSTRVKALTAPARARATVAVHDARLGVGRGQAVSARVETANAGGIVAERPIYFRYQPEGGGEARRGGHNAMGAPSAAFLPTIPVVGSPFGVAVNPATNRVYVAADNFDVGTVTVIDGAMNAEIAAIPVGDFPFKITANPATNRIYVTGISSGGTVTMIDGATNAVVGAPAPVGDRPLGVAVNPATNRVYVANANSDTVTVINGATNAVVGAPVPVGDRPLGVAANPTTNRVYVANANSDTVTVINGATGAAVGAPVPVGYGPFAVAVNPATNRVYVTNQGSNTVTVYQD